MSRTDELRMMLRVAQLYHEDKLKQADISQRLHVSQATVSRLLKRAEEEGVVRVTIAAPRGTYPQFETALRASATALTRRSSLNATRTARKPSSRPSARPRRTIWKRR